MARDEVGAGADLTKRVRHSFLGVATLVCALLWLAPQAGAAEFTVESTNDAGPGSLRAAIEAANADTSAAHLIDATGVSGTIDLATSLPPLDQDVTIHGPGSGSLTVRRDDAAGDFRIFEVDFEVKALLAGLTVANGRTTASTFGGAGIWNDRGRVVLRDVVVTGNMNEGTSNGADGGGIVNSSPGEMSILDSVVSANTANGKGGGIFNSGSGAVTVLRSAVVGNVSEGGAGCTGGGGIFSSGILTVVNSTVSGNEVPRAGGGIHICSTSPTSASIVNSTISANSASQGANLNVERDGASAELKSTILSSPQGDGENCAIDDPPTTFASLGYNLADDGSCRLDAVADQPGTDPLLGSLSGNGGPVPTHALSPESPAVDRGSADTGLAAFGPLVVDQRGSPRPVDFSSIANAPGGDGADIGAFELQELPPSPPSEDEGDEPEPEDTTVLLGINNRRLRINPRRGVVRVSLTCPRSEASPPCRGVLRLVTRGRFRVRRGKRRIVLAQRRYQIGAGGTHSIVLRLGRRKTRLVRRSRRARQVVAIAAVRDGAGNRTLIRKRLQLAVQRPRRAGRSR